MTYWTLALAPILAGFGAAPAPARVAPALATDTVVVRMVDKSASKFVFEPSKVTVHKGDVLEFLQTGDIPHDVQFTKTPKGAKIGAIQIGPMLIGNGKTYDIAIDGRFPVGHYAYDCLPHAALGMKGTFDVVAPAAAAPSSGK